MIFFINLNLNALGTCIETKKKYLDQNKTLMKITSGSGICQNIYHNGIMVVIHCYLERDTDKVLEFHLSNSSFFEKSTSFF